MGGGGSRVLFTAGYGRNETERMTGLPDSAGPIRFIDRLYRNGGGAGAPTNVKDSGASVNSFKDEKTLDEKNAFVLNSKKNGKVNGKDLGLNGKTVRFEGIKDVPETNIVVAKHWPLYESISKLVNGYHKNRPMPPVSETQIGDIANYFYLAWLVKKHPEDEAAKMEFDAYGPKYLGTLITLKGNFIKQGDPQKDLLIEARKKALRATTRMMGAHEKMEEQIAILERGKISLMGEFEREKLACEKWVDEVYARKGVFLTEWAEKKVTPFEDYLKKFGLPAGGVLAIAGTAFKTAVTDIVEHIPLIAGVPPELIGLGIIGLWVVARVGRSLLTWHLKTAKNRLPKKAEQKKEKELGRIAEKRLEAEQEHVDKVAQLKGEFELSRKEITKGLMHDYCGMVRGYGYACGI
ncbi:MAG: hypothetical protein NTV88_06040 [Candidatus Micrarchaeota archaeon]|nr:hypothetical protein [Candidatus Micrarchaeota archaeon]